jgi:hypothetical protein
MMFQSPHRVTVARRRSVQMAAPGAAKVPWIKVPVTSLNLDGPSLDHIPSGHFVIVEIATET